MINTACITIIGSNCKKIQYVGRQYTLMKQNNCHAHTKDCMTFAVYLLINLHHLHIVHGYTCNFIHMPLK